MWSVHSTGVVHSGCDCRRQRTSASGGVPAGAWDHRQDEQDKVAFEFANLPDGAWIVLRLDGKTFGIGQICSALESSATHPLNHLKPSDPKHEVFKYRKIVLSTKREIRLSLEERAPLMRTLKSYDPLRRFSSAEEVALLNRLLDTGGR